MAADILAIAQAISIHRWERDPAKWSQTYCAHGLTLTVGIEHPIGYMEAR